jgi:hypothetical protein
LAARGGERFIPGLEFSVLDDPRLPKLPIVIFFSLFLSMIAFEYEGGRVEAATKYVVG